MDYGNIRFVGNATLTREPTIATHVTSKQYVDNAVAFTAGQAVTLTAKQINVNVTNASVGVASNQLIVRSTASNGQLLRSTGTAGAEATWGALDLAQANSVTGILSIANGGTGANTAATARAALSATGIYRTTFTNATLVAGVLTVTHGLGNKVVTVQISDNTDKVIQPDDITLTSTTASTVDLTSFGTLTGTWNVIVTG
jgi:hypothetical protein